MAKDVADGSAPSGAPIAEDARPASPPLRSSLLIFMLAFVYVLVVALAIETIILPHFLPGLHAGHGLMVGHDSVGFHATADKLATHVETEGWGTWKLTPTDPGVVGVVAAVYAATGVHEPLMLIPVYAILYAVGATCIYSVTRVITGNERGAWLAAAVFVLFPSATMIYADLHKDAWSCAGILLLIAACADLQAAREPRWPRLVWFLTSTALALALIWLVRPYMIKLMLGGVYLGVAAVVAASSLGRVSWREQRLKYVGYALLTTMMMAVSFVSTAPLMDTDIRAPNLVVKQIDEDNSAIPAFADNPVVRRTVGAILGVREGVLSTPGGSIIDAEVRFPSVGAFIRYLPRALQIGLLAPFPNMWFERGMTPGARLMRLISGLEMSIAYALLLGWVVLLPRVSRVRIPALLFVTGTCLAVIVVMSLAMPNVGTLYRMRYPLFMIVVGLGAAGWAMALSRLGRKPRTALFD